MNEQDWITASIPKAPGSYALQLMLPAPLWLPIGRLGTCFFPAGVYLYLGSAFGPGGLRARLQHHARISARPHWHLDALRPHANLQGGWFSTDRQRLECTWSKTLAALPGVTVPAPGFGAADCRSGCAAHLLAISPGIQWAEVEDLFQASAAPGMPVFHFHR